MKKISVVVFLLLAAFSAAAQQALSQYPHLRVENHPGGGWTITSTDSRTRTVLAYSNTGRLETDDMPPVLQYWLGEYESQIMQLGDTPLAALEKAYQESLDKPNYPDSVAPLIQTLWTQSRWGYNSLVPYDSVIAADTNMAYLDGHPTVGCGALAMAQIMRYWRFPEHGYYSHSYTRQGEYNCWRYGTVSADFANTTYDYDNMPVRLHDSSTAAEVSAVATLAFHCGVACDMAYNRDCHGSSGSTISDNLSGFQHYFHYSNNATIAYKFNTPDETWSNMCKAELAAGRPIFYCGQSFENQQDSTEAGGHAFILDGYDSNGYFHVNWGWNGSCNAYYSLNVLRPLTQYNFTSYQYAIFGLEPDTNPRATFAMGSNLELNTTRLTQHQPISGRYSITNIGEAEGSRFFGVNIYRYLGYAGYEYAGCVDGRRITLQPGDTARCTFSYNLDLEQGSYMALMQYSNDTFYAGIPVDETMFMSDYNHIYQVNFIVEEDTANRVVTIGCHPDGVAIVSGSGSYPYGTQVQISIDTVLDTNYVFLLWSDLDTHRVRTITVVSDTAIDAVCVFKRLGAVSNVSQPQLKVGPNPASHIITIALPTDEAPVTLYNMQGRIVLQEQRCRGTLDVSSLPAGSYLLRTPFGTSRIVKR